MLQKLRSRHPVDVPVEGFGHKRLFLGVIGTIAVATVIIPLIVAFTTGLIDTATWTAKTRGVVAMGAGIGTLLLVLLVSAVIGKAGHDR